VGAGAEVSRPDALSRPPSLAQVRSAVAYDLTPPLASKRKRRSEEKGWGGLH